MNNLIPIFVGLAIVYIVHYFVRSMLYPRCPQLNPPRGTQYNAEYHCYDRDL